MMIQLHFQKILPEHNSILTDIHAASFGNASWNADQMAGSLALDTTQGWIAIDNEKPIGFILCQVLPEQIEILTFAVRQEMQKRGIGKKLLQKAIEALNTEKGARLFLEVASDNLAACHLYENQGFQRYGIRPNYYRRDNGSVDALLFERILSEQYLPKDA